MSPSLNREFVHSGGSLLSPNGKYLVSWLEHYENGYRQPGVYRSVVTLRKLGSTPGEVISQHEVVYQQQRLSASTRLNNDVRVKLLIYRLTNAKVP